jgi:hypothetical protein
MGSFPLREKINGIVVMFADGAKLSLNSIWVWVFKKVLWVRGIPLLRGHTTQNTNNIYCVMSMMVIKRLSRYLMDSHLYRHKSSSIACRLNKYIHWGIAPDHHIHEGDIEAPELIRDYYRANPNALRCIDATTSRQMGFQPNWQRNQRSQKTTHRDAVPWGGMM